MNITIEIENGDCTSLDFGFAHNAAELMIDDMHLSTKETLEAVKACVRIYNGDDFEDVALVTIVALEELKKRLIKQGKAFWEVKACYDLTPRPDVDEETLLLEMVCVLMFKGHRLFDDYMCVMGARNDQELSDKARSTIFARALNAFRREICS
jgi:hypothetical protein